MSILMLVGLLLVGLVALVVLGIIVLLVVRRPPSAERERSAPPAPPTQPSAEAPQPEPQPADAEFQVTRRAGGPHPRLRELDRESRRELLLLDERLHREFFDQSEMSPEEWARIADDLLIVHDRMPVGILLERFEQATDTTVSAPAQTERTAREIAALLNQQLSPEHRLTLIGTVDEPVEADVYAPE